MALNAKTIICISCACLLTGAGAMLLMRPKTLPEESRRLADAIFRYDVHEIERHLFESEKKAYAMDSRKRDALRAILSRCTSKVEILAKEKPEVAMAAGQGVITIRYRCKSSGKIYEDSVPSYLTPDGISTGLLDVLVSAWIMEYRSDVGDVPHGRKILIEAPIMGMQQDGERLRLAGFQQISQDGIRFLTLEQFRERLTTLRAQFSAAAQ
jgi:hypothetical protein